MSCVIKKICSDCKEERFISSMRDNCVSCQAKEQNKLKENHLNRLKTLGVQERLAILEENQYELHKADWRR